MVLYCNKTTVEANRGSAVLEAVHLYPYTPQSQRTSPKTNLLERSQMLDQRVTMCSKLALYGIVQGRMPTSFHGSSYIPSRNTHRLLSTRHARQFH